MKTKARFILSKSKVLEQYNKICDTADEVSFSFKTNREVGFILRDNTNCSFSVHSPRAIQLLKCPEKLWYFGQGFDNDELELVFEKGVKRFVVDNNNDMNMLIEYAKQKNIQIDLLLRMRLKEKTVHTGKHFVFGFFSKEINKLIPKLRSEKIIYNLGVHFHRKTQNISEWSLKYEIENILEKSVLQIVDYVNIGGGIPTRYKNFKAEVLQSIFKEIQEFREFLKKFNTKMIIEPGRFIAAPPVKLTAKIMNIYDHNIIIGCSVYNGAMDTFVTNIRLEVQGELDEKEGDAYTIKGKTPDSIDIFRYRVYLKNPKIGDYITFLNAGAYTYSTDFCLLEPLETEIID
ncbi:MAG: decarboxylase [Nanoarchaeota archaeon]